MSKTAFEKIKGGLDEALVIAPYVAEIERLRAENENLKLDFMQAVETELERHHPMLERLRAENEKLRAALKPFAEKADHHTQGAYWMDAIFTVDECRAAVKALENTK